jgi:hypothetical protein
MIQTGQIGRFFCIPPSEPSSCPSPAEDPRQPQNLSPSLETPSQPTVRACRRVPFRIGLRLSQNPSPSLGTLPFPAVRAQPRTRAYPKIILHRQKSPKSSCLNLPRPHANPKTYPHHQINPHPAGRAQSRPCRTINHSPSLG